MKPGTCLSIWLCIILAMTVTTGMLIALLTFVQWFSIPAARFCASVGGIYQPHSQECTQQIGDMIRSDIVHCDGDYCLLIAYDYKEAT
jgi:hypothetical protein